jgi:hypothetical protein
MSEPTHPDPELEALAALPGAEPAPEVAARMLRVARRAQAREARVWSRLYDRVFEPALAVATVAIYLGWAIGATLALSS